VVYFLVSNIWQIGQQAFMFRNQPKPEPGPAAVAKSKKGPTPPAGKGKGKPTTTKGARPTTKGAKGTKTLGGASGGSTKRGKSPANTNRSNVNKANVNKANGNKRRQDHGAPRPKGKPSRPGPEPRSEGRSGPDKPAADVKNDRSSQKSDGPDASPEISQPTTPGHHGTIGDTAVDELAEEATSSPSPLSPAGPSTQTAEPQGSNGSTPLAQPPPPAAGDLDKDGE